MIHSAYRQFKRAFDEEYGGFGNAPKFPSAHNLLFLLRYWSATGERTALDMVEKTLDMMRRGGIYDHIGFGFCRYSTDRKWLVPHFEKMLYDNAMLAMAYLEAFKATGNKHYGNTAREIFTYVQRNMTSPEGAFYSAEDADSEGKEGLFYIWKPDEIKSILGDKDGERFCVAFDITQYGNFEGFSIPNTLQGGDEDREFIERCRMKLYNAREKRVHPFKDDKVLTSWNGLVAAALAMGGRILSDVSLTDMAGKAIQFLDTRLRRTDGRLLARYRDKDASIPAYLDDYASVQWACLEMYETTYSPAYLEKALALNEDIENLFFDAENGGCFLYGSDAENLIMRPKDVYDGAMPSGNSMVAINLLRLYRLTGEPKFIDLFERQITAFGGQISAAPLGYTHMLSAFLAYLQTSQEVILVSDEPEESLTPYIEILRDGYRPFTTSIVYGKAYPALKSIVPHISGYTVTDGKTQAYVCRNFTCSRPVTDIKGFRQALS